MLSHTRSAFRHLTNRISSLPHQCLWLRQTLRELAGPEPAVRTSQYRRALDTAALALPGLPYEVTALLNEQHGAATYLTPPS